ncbi:MAG TPA: ABC transporter permease [Candidatus Tidjanibacter gallistercoris]|nr:ABC transporter permease [Candidatus Tidjanibacter gallistercoris]
MGRISSLFARRYLSSRNSLSVINIISRVSIFAVGVPVAAMVILLSVFNGFDGLVKSMYGVFDPELVVVPAEGKVFDIASIDERAFAAAGAESFSYVLEESVLLEYRGRQAAARLRGVDERYDEVVPVRETVAYGDYELRFGDMEQAVVGQGIAYDLGVKTALYDPLNVYAARRGEYSSLLPIDGYTVGGLFPAGIFRLDAETDGTYVLSTIEFAQQLLDYAGKASSVAVRVGEAHPESVRKKLAEELGDGFRVMTRYEQKASMYRIMKLEKLGIFFISLLVLAIASFSIIGSLVMLIIDKRPDIRILFTMGADVGFVRRIFVGEGMLIGGIGTGGGLVVGLIFALVQQHFGLIKIGAASFLVDAYPVVVRFWDIVAIAAAAFAVTWIINRLTVSRMIPKSSVRL